ncbi:MAG: 2-oxoacid:acceptor oxidoreductase family protein, partial [Chloroflexota bacterium]
MPPQATIDGNEAPAAPAVGGTTPPHAERFFEMRFESIGGLGAHAAGQVLATAAVLRMELNGAHFSSYGSEKKGSRVLSFVRLGPGDRPIRTSAPVETPDAIVVFHAALLRDPATLAGLRKDGTFVYDAPPGAVPEELAALPPTGELRMSATPHANGGTILRDLVLPDFRDYAVKVSKPGSGTSEA